MSSSTAGRNDATVMVAVEKSLLMRLEKVNLLARTTLPCFFQSSSKIVEEKTPLKLKAIKAAPVRNSTQTILYKNLSSKINFKYKPIIVLDLDETMIFGADMSDEYKFVGSDYSFKMGPTGFHVKLRPGILKLLEFLQSRFELWVYSNGRAEYVHKILNYIGQLGPKIDSSRVLPRDGNNYNKRLSRVIEDSNHEHFHQLIILDDSFESWKQDKTSHEKILPSKRFITWRDYPVSQNRTQANYLLSERCILDEKYMKVFLEDLDVKEGYHQIGGLLTFLEKYYKALLHRQMFLKNLTPSYLPTKELFRRIKMENLTSLVDLKGASLMIKNDALRNFITDYLRWLGVNVINFDIRDKSIKPSIIIDDFDPLYTVTNINTYITDPIQKAQCYRINLVFDSYFNMPLLPLRAYKYFNDY